MRAAPLKVVAALAFVLLAGNLATAAQPARAAYLSDIEVNEPVEGDVVALVGDVKLGPDARVSGHVVTVIGAVTRAPGAEVSGRVIAIRSLDTLTLDPETTRDLPWLTAAVRLLTCGAWMLAVTGLAFFFPVRLRVGIWAMPRLGLQIGIIGVMGYATLIAALVAVIGLGPGLGVPLAATLAVIFLAGKAVGLTVLGGALGSWLLTRWVHRPLPLTVPVSVGMVVLLSARFIPLIGGFLWTLVSLAAIGAAVFCLALSPSPEGLEMPVRNPGPARHQ